MTFTFNEERHEYFLNGRRLPSVTEVLKPITDGYLSRCPPHHLERKRQIGAAVDAAITLDVLGTIDEESVWAASWAGYFMAWRDFLMEKNPVILSVQRRVYHPQWEFAGTIDLEIMSDDWYSITDVKCTYDLHPAVKLQTAAYKEMVPEATKRHSLLLREDGRYEFEEHEGDDFGVFLALLNVYRWKENHKCL